jgi:hypothetical protein
MLENIKELVNNCNNFTDLMKFVDVEKHYQELNQEERKIIQDLAKVKIQDLAKENTK